MGTVVVSLDAELAWGFHDLPSLPWKNVTSARRGWQRTLSLLDRFELPATWAVVGHLFLDHCDGRHADHPAPPDWFARDPGGDAPDRRYWFGDGLVSAIVESPVDHEIACHSFSHQIFGSSAASRQMVDAELAASVEAANTRGLSLSSFVFPRNRIGHRDLLAEHGFDCYRATAEPNWYDNSRVPTALGKFASFSVGRNEPPTVTPFVDEYGLVAIPYSVYCFTFEGLPRQFVDLAQEKPVVQRAKRGIDVAAENGELFHLWFHPNDLVTDACYERVGEILEYVAESEQNGQVVVKTMATVAEECRAGRASNEFD